MTTRTNAEAAEPIYEPASFVMIRTPLLPLDVLRSWLDLPLESPAYLAIAGDAIALGDALAHDALAAREQLRTLVGDPIVQEAILTGSPDLFQAIARWQQAPDSRKGRQAQANLLRYLIRMTTRPTPFGLFAGVALGQVGPAMDVRIEPPERSSKRTRPDMQWLLYLIRSLEQRAEVVAQLRFFTNPVTFTSAGRLYLPHLDSYGQAEGEKTISLRATPVVLRARELARLGATLDQLQQQLQIERPNATAGQIQGLLDGLRQQGALLSDLRPPLTGEDAISYVLGRIDGIAGCDDIREQLRTVQALAATYDAQPIGQGIAAFQALYAATEVPDAQIHSTLEVDLATACAGRSFSADVAAELARAAEVMLRISTVSPQFQHLTAYRREFMERYGEGREVPLLELLDEDIGLGPPAGYQNPPRIGESPAQAPPQHPARDAALMELAADALRSGQHEIVLDEPTLARLQVRDNWRELLPDSLELYAAIAAPSQAALNAGDYTAVIGPRIGDQPAGRSFGRFCDILGSESVQALERMARAQEAAAPERIFAELVYLPARGHAANVAIRPALRRYEIVMAAAPGVAYSATVPMHDLVVGLRGDRLYVRSLTRDAEVVTSSTHLLNYLMAPNECRFLAEIAAEGTIRLYSFDWGAATSLSVLPRVRVGRTVLHPAQWRMPFALMGRDQTAAEPAAWYQTVQEWRRAWNIPRYVYLTESDNRLLLDMENPLCVADLGDECRKRAASQTALIVQEMLPSFAESWTEGPRGRYLVEFIVPLQRRRPAEQPQPQPPARHAPSAPSMRQRLPGSDWLFAKLYSGRTRHDDLLAEPVRTFAAQAISAGQAERWFFIRYADPEPHIRLRFQGDPTRLLAELLPALTTWSRALTEQGLIRKLVLDTYDREVERYGGPAGIAVAERIFAADSSAVAEVVALRLRRVLEFATIDLALLTIDDLVASLGLAAAERLRLYQTIRAGQERQFGGQINRMHKHFHGYRKSAQRIVGDRAWLRTQPGGPALEAALARRTTELHAPSAELRELVRQEQLGVPQASFLASCIHMHFNRLIGLNRALEFESIYYLERTFESLARYRPDNIQIG
jgi:thiopeptide-type bacteriocin biosynthesis protein